MGRTWVLMRPSCFPVTQLWSSLACVLLDRSSHFVLGFLFSAAEGIPSRTWSFRPFWFAAIGLKHDWTTGQSQVAVTMPFSEVLSSSLTEALLLSAAVCDTFLPWACSGSLKSPQSLKDDSVPGYVTPEAVTAWAFSPNEIRCPAHSHATLIRVSQTEAGTCATQAGAPTAESKQVN